MGVRGLISVNLGVLGMKKFENPCLNVLYAPIFIGSGTPNNGPRDADSENQPERTSDGEYNMPFCQPPAVF